MKGAQGQIPGPSVPCLTHLLVSKLTNGIVQDRLQELADSGAVWTKSTLLLFIFCLLLFSHVSPFAKGLSTLMLM